MRTQLNCLYLYRHKAPCVFLLSLFFFHPKFEFPRNSHRYAWWIITNFYCWSSSVVLPYPLHVSLFFNDVSKILVVNQMITDHKEIYNLFGSGTYHKPHSIFKSKSYEFYNRNIGLFSGNGTIMAGYFIGMHRDLRIRKEILATVSSDEFNTMALNSNFPFTTLFRSKATYAGFQLILFSRPPLPTACILIFQWCFQNPSRESDDYRS